jgi:hypothetical protein
VQGFGAKLAASFGLASCLIGLSVGEVAAAPVDDASRATARKLGYSGVEAYQAGDFAAASDKLERALSRAARAFSRLVVGSCASEAR